MIYQYLIFTDKELFVLHILGPYFKKIVQCFYTYEIGKYLFGYNLLIFIACLLRLKNQQLNGDIFTY